MIGTLLDTLLPGDAGFPPASATDLAARLAAHDRFGPTLAPVVDRLPPDFPALSPATRIEAVRAVEAAAPAAFAALITGVYSLYYTHPAVAAAIAAGTGHAARPPQPGGHVLAAFDPAMVAVPAARPPSWRSTPEEKP
jgi:hypothetical protein